MMRLVLVLCAVAGGLCAKLPGGGHQGPHSEGARHHSQPGGYNYDEPSSSGLGVQFSGSRTGAPQFGGNQAGSQFGANRPVSPQFSVNQAVGGTRAGGAVAAGSAGLFNTQGGSFGVGGAAGASGQGDNGQYRPQNLEANHDDGLYKPHLYSGDDGLYKEEQYAPNTDASYQFQFDAGDHGRDEAADQAGNVDGSFYAVHPDGLRRDVEFNAGPQGFVVTKDESVQGPVPEYALRQAAKPKKEYPPADIRTSLSPDGIFHWEYDAGDSSRSEDINLNTNFYQGNFEFLADDDQQRYRVEYEAGAGIGFVPRGDHLPMQVQETPEVAAARAEFLEKYSVIEAEAKKALSNGHQQAYNAQASGYAGQRINGFGGQRVSQAGGFSRQRVNQGNSGFSGQRIGQGSAFSNQRLSQTSGFSGQRKGQVAGGSHSSQATNSLNNNNQGHSAQSNQAFRQQSSFAEGQAGRPASQQAFTGTQSQSTFVQQGLPAAQASSQGFRQQSFSSGSSGAPGAGQASSQGFRQQSFSSGSRGAPGAGQASSQGFRQQSFSSGGSGAPGAGQGSSQGFRQQSFSSGSSGAPGAGQASSQGFRQQSFSSSSSSSASGTPGFSVADNTQKFNAVRNDDSIHPSMMVSSLAMGGHMKKEASQSSAQPAQLPNSYLPPN